MYYQVAAVIGSVPVPAAAAAGCRLRLCRPARRIFDINCPSAAVADRATSVGNDP